MLRHAARNGKLAKSKIKTGANRGLLRALLHPRNGAGFDNSRIWAGNMSIEVNGRALSPHHARVFLDDGDAMRARVTVELFVAGLTGAGLLARDDVDARLWLDFNEHGFLDERGVHHPPAPRYEPLHLLCDTRGRPLMRNGNQIFISGDLPITTTGVFNFTAAFSADDLAPADPAKQWTAINEIFDNRDGLLVVSPGGVRECSSIMEVCPRKYGATIQNGVFHGGTIKNISSDLENIPCDVIYLLPFFEPGTGDLFTGEDVRKGDLGSIYAVRDFFRIDPALATPPRQAGIPGLVSLGLIVDQDLAELLTGKQQAEIPNVSELAGRDIDELLNVIGEDTLTQIIARAEMRWLTQKAHGLGKRVIFDLVLMQTSRDCPLIREHIDWYSLDENGIPLKHRIAWLDYSDVALFDLKFNKPLQNYLSAVAPYWIKTCGLDGVRIDAAQTVDRPFLKQIKNRINAVKPDALVLGETLCHISEAVDVPTDMIYTLLVDHHVRIKYAGPYIDLFEEIHRTFEPGATGMAYFENHDSARATFEWHKQYCDALRSDPALLHYWITQSAGAFPQLSQRDVWSVAYYPALLKNIMSSIINMSAGAGDAVRFAYAIEAGTDWGEEQRTDFEHANVLYPRLRGTPPHSFLSSAYARLDDLKKAFPVLHQGRVYYLRNADPDDDPTDSILSYVKYDGKGRAALVACNLDPASAHHARCALPFLNLDHGRNYALKTAIDTYDLLNAQKRATLRASISGGEIMNHGIPLLLPPLCAVIVMLA